MMRDDAIKFDKGPDTAANDLTRVRVGRTRISLGNPGWIGLLLASLIVLPCLPIPRPVPEFTPTSWARGSGEPLINRFAYSPDGQRFVTTYLDGRAALWTLTNQHYNMRILDSAGYAHTVAFSSDGQCVFLGGAETDVVVCDVRRPGAERRLGITNRQVSALRLSPNGRTLAVSEYLSNDVILWDVDAARERRRLKGHQSSAVSLAFTPDGRSLASVSLKEYEVFLWDVAGGRLRQRFSGPSRPVLCLEYSPDGRLLFTAGGGDLPVQIWDAETSKLVRAIPCRAKFVHSLALSPDGRLLVTERRDGAASLWSVASGREIRRLVGQADWIRNVAFSPDGRTVAATGNDADIRFWDLASVVGGPIDP